MLHIFDLPVAEFVARNQDGFVFALAQSQPSAKRNMSLRHNIPRTKSTIRTNNDTAFNKQVGPGQQLPIVRSKSVAIAGASTQRGLASVEKRMVVCACIDLWVIAVWPGLLKLVVVAIDRVLNITPANSLEFAVLAQAEPLAVPGSLRILSPLDDDIFPVALVA
jgi:hypothetical protein